MSDKPEERIPSAFEVYWKVYGGFPALLRSKYAWFSVGLTVLLWRTWSTSEKRTELGSTILGIIPNLLGFTIGAMAILLAFSTSSFFAKLTENGKSDSAYLDLASKFVHFILLQAIALFSGIILKSYNGSIPLGFIGCFFLAYSIATAVATGLALFGMAEIYNRISSDDHEEK
jgi:hypothetical protein